jgi:hypothetical protein
VLGILASERNEDDDDHDDDQAIPAFFPFSCSSSLSCSVLAIADEDDDDQAIPAFFPFSCSSFVPVCDGDGLL